MLAAVWIRQVADGFGSADVSEWASEALRAMWLAEEATDADQMAAAFALAACVRTLANPAARGCPACG